MGRPVLVTGASIAGSTAAYWLARHGFDVTIVERSRAFRDGGQNVDVRGAGRDVLKRMGLDQAALRAGTGETGTAWVDEAGREIARFTTEDSGASGITAELEILRGDLAKLLLDAAERAGARVRFGDAIREIDQTADGVVVQFESGRRETCDHVVVAEGVGSSTRELVMPGENRPRWLDVCIGYFDIPRVAGDGSLWLWYHTTGGRSASLRPGRDRRTMALLTIQKPSGGEESWPPAEQKAFLARQFAQVGWQTPRILEGLEGSDWFYFDALRQVRLERWGAGRVILTGDAAWCVTPLAGIGTTLALVGAYVLAGELARAATPAEALERYEGFMRPIVSEKQNVPKILPRLFNPHTKAGLSLFRAVLHVLGLPGIRTLAGRTFLGADLEVRLPDFG